MKSANIIAYLLVASQAVYGSETCWKKLASRGVGTVPTECPDGMVLEAGLCYQPCIEGYSSFLTTCTQNLHCPSPWTEILGTCAKPLAYDRLPCWGSSGCKKIGWFYYPYCRSGYHDVGTWCHYGCPSDMIDIGAGCAPRSYDRGVGIIPTDCPAGKEYDAGLCYQECTWEDSDGDLIDADGVGPVCWGSCPDGTEECGAICLEPGETCGEYILDATEAAINMAISYA